MSGRRQPTRSPARTTVRWLIWLTAALLLANLAHQTGIG